VATTVYCPSGYAPVAVFHVHEKDPDEASTAPHTVTHEPPARLTLTVAVAGPELALAPSAGGSAAVPVITVDVATVGATERVPVGAVRSMFIVHDSEVVLPVTLCAPRASVEVPSGNVYE
jgi:hypothetical protein